MNDALAWIADQLALLADILIYLLPAVPVTIEVTFLSFALALAIGVIAGTIRVAKLRFFSSAARIYVDVIRGVPLLVLIFFIYFGLGGILNIGRMTAGVISLGVCYGAYIAEIFRAGILAIPKGQFEAALSLGMTRQQTFRHVIIPQAFRIAIPPIANEFIACLKDSSLVSVIAMREITRAGREYFSRTFADFQVWLVVAILYLILTITLAKVVSILERKFKMRGYGVSS
ncbi:MAG: amino acid ABC transporter permease [Candidatus Zixiibacteriota bacterium]